jgi:hypothetical protein
MLMHMGGKSTNVLFSRLLKQFYTHLPDATINRPFDAAG